MAYDPTTYKLKSIYLPNQLCDNAGKQAKSEYMNFSAYVRKLIVEDLKRNDLTTTDKLN